jgi:glycosyltransferase involved in cell wall biosynthesis
VTTTRRLLVTTSYPRRPGDAAGCFVEARVQRLRAAGELVTVLCAGEPPGPDAVMSEPGLTVERVGHAVAGAPPLFYAGGAPERLEAAPGAAAVQALSLWGGLLPAIAAHTGGAAGAPPPDQLESHWLVPSALAVAAVRARARLPTPHCAHLHSGDVALLERLPFGAALARWVVARSDELVFASADLRDRLARLVGGNAEARVRAGRVAPALSGLLMDPPARPAPAARSRLRAARGVERPVVLAVGRLVPIKGHDLLIRAAGRLPPALRPAIVVLGEGPARAGLARLAARLRVDVRLPGEVPQAEVAGWLACAELFAQPSRVLPGGRTEGTPVALREALAALVPAIVTATGGMSELARLHPSLATIVAAEDPAALAAAIERHLTETQALPWSDS